MRRAGRWLLAVIIVLVVVAAGAAAFLFWPEREERVAASPGQPTGDALIQRGEYLARAADCYACHTAPGGRDFAGGLPFKLPFGTIYASNITPDKETGIGAWSDAEFVRALHRGVSRDGHMLYPAFPYAAYALMSTDDALAIKAYLFSVPAVHAPTPASTLAFPYNQRSLMRAWRLLFVPDKPFQPEQGRPAEWNRGAYLVEALGHCGECHTPRNLLYARDQDRKFAGAVVEGWKAYNLTPDRQSGIGGWTDEQLVSYLSQGWAPGRGAAAGSMGDAVTHSLRYLTADDLHAMVAYLRSLPPHASDPPTPIAFDPPATKASAYAPAAGEGGSNSLGLRIFQNACSSCHGWNGEGLQHPQAALLGSQTANDPQATNLVQVVLRGARVTTDQGDAFMPGFGKAYSDAEIAAVANYVIGHFGAKRAAVTPADVAAARKAD